MIVFAAAFATFLALYSVPALPAVRAEIIRRTGRPIYLAVYSALSLTALAWVFSCALSLDYVPLWDLQPWHAAITFVLAPAGLFLALAGLFSQNPLSVSIRSTGQPASITRTTRLPVLWGMRCGLSGTLLPTAMSDRCSSLVDLLHSYWVRYPWPEKRAKRRLGLSWGSSVAGTSIVPLATVLRRSRVGIDRPIIVALLVAAVTTAWLLYGGDHAMLVGAPSRSSWNGFPPLAQPRGA